MAKQSFSTGQVLTAAQMTSLQQTAMGGGSPSTKTASYVLVAADAGTVIQMNSASATTVTVNTSLFAAGDSVQIQNIGAGVMTITAGTATVNSAGSLGVTQYDGGFLYFSSTSSAIWFDFTQAGTTLPLTTKGDLFGYSTTNARVPIGTNGQVLTADSTEALGLKWATSASGGMTLLSTTTLSGTTTISGISGSYTNLVAFIYGVTHSPNNNKFRCAPNGSTNITTTLYNNTDSAITTTADEYLYLTGLDIDKTSAVNSWAMTIYNYASTASRKPFSVNGSYFVSYQRSFIGSGSIETTSAITSLVFSNAGGSLSTGTVLLYGVK